MISELIVNVYLTIKYTELIVTPGYILLDIHISTSLSLNQLSIVTEVSAMDIDNNCPLIMHNNYFLLIVKTYLCLV